MRVAVIGGTGFIGRATVRLLSSTNDLLLIHRGKTPTEGLPRMREILAARTDLAQWTGEFARFRPDVVLDTISASEPDARLVSEIFRGIAGRLVTLSSMDVYRAYEVLLGIVPGPLEPTPITEGSSLRSHLFPYRSRGVRVPFDWVDPETYDKIPVERAASGFPDLPATILRLPMVYGPGDPLHRFFPWLKRMADGRPAILMDPEMAAWKGCWGYVENVAAAIALAVTDPRAAGRVYHVAEPDSPAYAGLAAEIGSAAGWNGRIAVLPRTRLPEHLRVPFNNAQHWTVDSRRIRDELGYREPVSRRDAILRTVAWERRNPPAEIDLRLFDYAAEDAAIAAHEAEA